MPVALITGASEGLGKALATALAERHWALVIDARRAPQLLAVADELRRHTDVRAIVGDVTDIEHRAALARAVDEAGRLDLLVNNASTLGPTPLRPLAEVDVFELAEVFRTNAGAPFDLITRVLPMLRRSDGAVVNVSSDAAIEHYERWGAYGAGKAALDHLTLTLAAENPSGHFYAIDPGDMRTAMHQAAYVGEDISDRPLPETVVPALLNLIDARPVSGRYRAAEFATSAEVAS